MTLTQKERENKRQYERAYYAENREKMKKTGRMRYRRDIDKKREQSRHYATTHKNIRKKWAEDNKDKMRKSCEKYRNQNKIKTHAHYLANYAIATGRLVRGRCEVCGNNKVEAHHDNYLNALEVRWLCHIHHCELHKEKRGIS
jgi:hypothetical protein